MDGRGRDDRCARFQVRQSRLNNPKWCINIGLDRRVEVFIRQVLDCFPGLLAAGIVDNYIKATEPLHSVLDEFATEVLVHEIAGQGEPLATFGQDQPDDLLGIFLFFGDGS